MSQAKVIGNNYDKTYFDKVYVLAGWKSRGYMTKILIVGCGDLGAGLAKKLVARECHVSAVRLTGTSFPEGVHGITGDILFLQDSQLPDVDMVFIIVTPQGRTEESYQQAYLATAQRLIKRYQSTAYLPKVFFVSSTSVYGQNNGESLDEDQIAQPASKTAKVLLQTEETLQAHLPTTNIRFSGIYGGERFRLIEQAIQQAEWPDDRWTNRIHREDCIEVLAFLAAQHQQGQELENIYIATDDCPVRLWEVKHWLAQSLGVASNQPNAKVAIAKPAGKRLSNQRLTKLGFQFTYPDYVAGYTESIKKYRTVKQ